MNKLGVMLTTCLLGLTLTACGTTPAMPAGSADTTDTGSASVEPAIPSDSSVPSAGSASGSSSAQEDPNTRVYRDCSVTVLGYSIREDRDGDPALRVECQFRNDSKTSASFSTTVIPNAYQGDPKEALAYATPAEADPEYSALLTLLAPGESIICAGYFKLSSVDLPVELEIKDLRDSSADALCVTLDITGMPMEDYPESDLKTK
ncbi:DUF5067 domain-containing protein [Butyricicoccus sp.]|uniref:DUF5067 domain-containing protein n=1 Tax=Butyricicoccus sp. TaxID=2049021 RepID=UPI003736042A